TAPKAPTITVDDGDGDGKPEASGKAETGSKVTVIWPDGTTSTTTAGPEGKWSVESETVQKNGKVKATATDVNGNESEAAKEDYTDKTAPKAPTLTVTDSDGDGKPEASGTGEAGSKVTVIWPDGTTSTTTAAGPEGKWSVESETVQKNGKVKATATDVNGNESEAAKEDYTDNTPPQKPTLTVDDGDGDGQPEVSGTAEANSNVEVTWPDGTTKTVTTGEDGNWSIEAPTEQKSGQVKATVTDVNGNEGGSKTENYTNPDEVSVTVTDGDGDGRPEASGVTRSHATVTVAWPDGSTSKTESNQHGEWSVESKTVQKNGKVTATVSDADRDESNSPKADHNGEVKAADGDGEPGETNYVDNTPPQKPKFTVTDSDGDGRPEASGTAEPKSEVTVTWPDGTVKTTTTDEGKWSVESDAVQKSGRVAAMATDVNGNDGDSATENYTDKTAPKAPTITVDDGDGDGKPEASGKAETGSKVTVTWPDGTRTTTTAGPEGKWSVESETVQKNGKVTATATDVNGNESEAAKEDYTDKTAPKAPTLTVDDGDGDGQPEASGTAEANSNVEVAWPDGTTKTVTTGEDGNWSIEAPTEQKSGQVKATVTDVNGNEGGSKTVEFDNGNGGKDRGPDLVHAEDNGRTTVIRSYHWNGSSYDAPITTKVNGDLAGSHIYDGGQAARLVDLNNDGVLDYVSAKNGKLSALFGNGDGTFSTNPVTTNFGATKSGDDAYETTELVDINNDGNLDYVYANDNLFQTNIAVHFGNGDGTFSGQKTTRMNGDFAGDHFDQTTRFADLNNDGNLDYMHAARGEIAVFLGDGNGGFSTSRITSPSKGLEGKWTDKTTQIADLNGDGNADYLFASDNGFQTTVHVLLGRGDGTFSGQEKTTTLKGDWAGYHDLFGGQTTNLVDANGDGILDYVSLMHGKMAIFHGSGDGTFSTDPTVVSVPAGEMANATTKSTLLGAVFNERKGASAPSVDDDTPSLQELLDEALGGVHTGGAQAANDTAMQDAGPGERSNPLFDELQQVTGVL
ncbi:Ig-like domain-containing protein, partial [Nitratireductor sp. GCM10026969]|uniref:Ig-like domain-containing protein n=1 Tax=Nitratireductor sp. GCM10026969 TaxID=3252645 RepID=UPI003620D3E4